MSERYVPVGWNPVKIVYDVVAVATPILRHRLILNFAAQSEGVTVEDIIKQLVKSAAKQFQAA